MTLPHRYQDQHIELALYQHDEKPLALLLSRDGNRRNAHWIPRALAPEPQTRQLVNIDGEACARGIFYIATWKAKEIGWMEGEAKQQLRLV